jgi:hypothetical protein
MARSDSYMMLRELGEMNRSTHAAAFMNIASKTLILDNISGKMALRHHYTRV